MSPKREYSPTARMPNINMKKQILQDDSKYKSSNFRIQAKKVMAE